MVVIWYAIGLYIFGIAVALYMRPSLMFQPGGMWKEFGISKRDEYSVFPFWLFTVVWAIFSYALATLISILLASVVLRSSSEGNVSMNENIFIKPISSIPSESILSSSSSSFPASNLQPSISSNTGSPRIPGYYVLENATTSMTSRPRYVYWGPDPPHFV